MAKVQRKRVVTQSGTVQGGENRAMWLGGILVVLLLAVALIVYIGRDRPATIVEGEYEGIPAEGTTLGEPGAPVVVQEFIDFKCPHCQSASQSIIPNVISEYVENGDVRLEFVPVAFLDQSLPGAEASYCAMEQGGFMAYHDTLFANQRSAFNIDNLTNWAGSLGLDEQQFRGCLTAGKYRQQIEQNLQQFRSMGASSTPTFFINGTPVVGAVPYAQIKSAIDSALAQ